MIYVFIISSLLNSGAVHMEFSFRSQDEEEKISHLGKGVFFYRGAGVLLVRGRGGCNNTQTHITTKRRYKNGGPASLCREIFLPFYFSFSKKLSIRTPLFSGPPEFIESNKKPSLSHPSSKCRLLLLLRPLHRSNQPAPMAAGYSCAQPAPNS